MLAATPRRTCDKCLLKLLEFWYAVSNEKARR
jgi:hypothetical protein